MIYILLLEMVLLIAVVTLVVGFALKVLCCGTLPYPFTWLCPVSHIHMAFQLLVLSLSVCLWLGFV
jgi:hypothetical protein